MFDILNNLPDVNEEGDPIEDTAEEAPVQEPEAPTEEGEQPTEEGGDSSPEPEETPDYSFIPDGWRPGEFANSDEEREFYKEKYIQLHQYMQSDDFSNAFLDSFSDNLAEREKEVENFKGLMQSFKADPQAFIAANMPEYAEALGLQPQLSDDQIDEKVDETIAEEFGEDWESQYDPADLRRRSSLSSKIFRRRQELERQYEEQNANAVQAREQYIQSIGKQQAPAAMDPEAQVQVLEQAYEEIFKPSGFSEEEFIQVVENVKGFQPTMADLYNMTHFEEIIEAERQEAIEEGKRAVIEQLRSAGKIAASDYELPPEPGTPERRNEHGFLGMKINI